MDGNKVNKVPEGDMQGLRRLSEKNKVFKLMDKSIAATRLSPLFGHFVLQRGRRYAAYSLFFSVFIVFSGVRDVNFSS